MKRKAVILLAFLVFYPASGQSWIRINQLGYLPESVKVGVFISTEVRKPGYFTLCDAISDKAVFRQKAEMLRPDDYSVFQNGKVVYHDEIGDYSTNEPTMDGTASPSFVLYSLEGDGRKQSARGQEVISDDNGAIIRKDAGSKVIHLIFQQMNMVREQSISWMPSPETKSVPRSS